MDLLEQLQYESEAAMVERRFDSVEAAEIAFNNGLEEVALLADDEAFSIIRESMDYMYTSGEFERVQQMAMVLGAMACTHDHIQEFSMKASEQYADAFGGSKHDDGHNHAGHDNHEDDDEDDEDFKKKKNKKKTYPWFK